MAPEPDEAAGASAEVGVRKINEDGEIVQEEGYLAEGERRIRGWIIVIVMAFLSIFGIWKLVELVISFM